MEISILSDEERAQLKHSLILKQKLHKTNQCFKRKRKLSTEFLIQNQPEEKKIRTVQNPSKEIFPDPSAQNNKVEKKEKNLNTNGKERRTLVSPTKRRARKNKLKTSKNNNNKNKNPINKRNSNKLSKLQFKMQQKLKEGHFRFLNEKLYTSTSHEAFQFFQQNPQLFFEV
jgi:hypothetical protein